MNFYQITKTKAILLPSYPYHIVKFLLFLCLLPTAIKAQSFTVSTTPATTGGVAYICLDDANTVTYTASYAFDYDSIVWVFAGGNISSDTGTGPITVSYASSGLYSTFARVYNNGVVQQSVIYAVDAAQIAPISIVGLADTVCNGDDPFALTGAPLGGTFSGPGVSNNTFDPDAAGLGNHTLTYIVNQGACSDTVTQTVNVLSSPNTILLAKGFPTTYAGVLTYSTCDTTNPFFFEFHSITDSTTYVSYTFEYGDGNSISGTVFPTAPTYIPYTYPATGLYIARLTLVGANGCTRTDEIQVFVGVSPALGFTRSGTNMFCLPRVDSGYVEVCFNILNTASNDPSTVYVVQYNDGSVADTFYHPAPDSVCHRFYEGSCGFTASASNNSFEATITAINPCGSNTFSNSPIYISEPPSAEIAASERACVDDIVSIFDSTDTGDLVLNNGDCVNGNRLIWDISPNTFTLNGPASDMGFTFGNTDPAFWFGGAQTLDVVFNRSGIYTITQIAGNSLQCGLDTAFLNICVDTIPTSGFELSDDTVCVGENVTAQFTGELFTVCDTVDLDWRIEPDTGVTYVSASPFDTTRVFSFSIEGFYDIILTASNNCDSVLDTLRILVQGLPSATFPTDTAICGLTTLDYNQAHIQPSYFTNFSEITYLWDVSPALGWSFTNGTSATSQYPEIDFTAFGAYIVTVTVTNDCGSFTDSMNVSLTEEPELIALATPFRDTLICPGTDLPYKAGTIKGFGPFAYTWGSASLGTVSTSDSIFLGNITQDTTIYVSVTDSLGCYDSASFTIFVAPIPVVDAGSDITICYSDSVQLNASVTGGLTPLTYLWSPDTGLSANNILNPWRAPLDTSITYVLTITDSLGCVYTDTLDVNIFPLVNIDAGPDQILCINQGTEILANGIPIGGTWTGTGVSGGSTFDPVIAGLGIHTLTYSYTDANGCDYSDTILMEVIQQPSLNFVLTPDSGCTDLLVTISDSTGVSGHRWYVNDSLFSTVKNPSLTLQNSSSNQDSIFAIKLVFIASSNCTDSLTQFVTVFPKPNAAFALPSFICAGESIQPTQNSVFKTGTTQFEWTASSGSVIFNDSSLAVPTLSFPDFQTGTDSSYTIQLIITSVDGCADTVSETINVRSRPVSSFSLPPAACTPLNMGPTNSSTGGGLSYQWTINPLSNVTVANSSSAGPTFSFITPVSDSIVYSITLYVTDTSGCIDSSTQTYTTYPQPQLGISKSQNNGCHPFTLTITNNSTSGISGLPALTYAWDLGNGQTSIDTNITTVYTNTGTQDSTYYIQLIATNALGCPDTLIDSIVVHPNPIAQANFSSFTNCAPYLIDSNAVNAVLFPNANATYSWNVYDLNNVLIAQYNGATGMNHTLLVGGDSVYIELVATSLFGCTNDTSGRQLFYTITNPTADFSTSPDTSCSPMLLSLSDSSTAGVSHQWYVNDSLFSTLQNPQITLFNLSSTTDSIVDIKLVITAGSGCGDSITKQVVIQAKPNATFIINSNTCAGDSLQTINNSTSSGPLTYSWSASSSAIIISDTAASQPSFIFPDNQSGTDSIYNIQLIALSSAGCADTSIENVTIFSRPVAGFTLPSASCGPVNINPMDTSSGNGIMYNWSVTPTTGVTLSGGNTSTPQLDFVSPIQDSLVYTISLLLTDANGCLDSFSSNYSVYPLPTAAFIANPDSACHPMSVNLSNNSSSNITGQNRSTMNFEWNFSDGSSSTDSVPAITFTNTGIVDSVYTIELIVTNSLGCSDTLVDSVVVHPLPRAELNFTANANCAPFVIDTSVVNASLYPNTNASYTWNIYNTAGVLLNQIVGANNLSHTINTGSDSIYLELITTSLFGCTNDTSAQQLFYTIENPVADFVSLPDTGCSPLLLSLIDSSTAGVSHQWYINGSPFSTNQNPQISLLNLSSTSDSIVDVKLVITAGTGCADSITKQVVIQAQPIAQFSITPTTCASDSLTVTNNSISGSPLTYNWSASSSAVRFNSANDSLPFIIFPDNQSGTDSTYTIQLIVTTSSGCSDTATQNVLIYSRPTANFSLPSSSCGPLTINPTNNSTGNNLTYLWSVSPITDVTLTGDSTASPQLDFTAPLFDSAVYILTLNVLDSNGCSDSISYPYSVYPKPIAGFLPSDTMACGPLNLTFINTSISSLSAQDRSTMTFNWGFGNGQNSSDSVPSQIFTNSGVVDSIYTIQLIVMNSLGCSDTIVDSVTVHPNPVAELDTTGIIDCAPFVLDSNAAKAIVYNQANLNYTWSVYDGTTGTLLHTANGYDSLNYTMFNDEDSVVVELIVSSPFGCDNDTATQKFYTLPDSRPGFVIDQITGCHPHTISITDTSKQGASHQWFINGVLSSTVANPVFTLTNTALNADSVYRVTLISTVAGSGCIDSVIQFVTVYPLPQPSFTATEVCIGNVTQFTGTAQPIDSIVQWHWDFGDGNTDTIQNTTHTYLNFGTYTILFTATDTRGCSQTFIDSVIVRPNPVADFIALGSCGPDTLCIGQTFTFSDSSTIDPLGGSITQWSWDINNDGSVDYTTQNPQHQFNAPGLYSVKLTIESQHSCPDSTVRQVFVQDSLIPFFATDTTASCGPLNITVSDSSTGPIETYQWELYSLDNNGNKTSIYLSNQTNPNPIPTLIPGYERDTTYILELTLGNCCETVSFQRQFTLKPLPVANFAILPDDTVCISDIVQIQLDGLVNGLPDSLILDYGDGTPAQRLTQAFRIVAGDTVWFWGVQSHSFSNPSLNDTIYTISLTAKNECGDSTVTANILVLPNLVQAFFTTSRNTGCEDLTVTLRDVSFGGTYTSWCLDFDTATNTCTQFAAVGDSVVHTYTQHGTYIIAQFVEDGCSGDTAYTTINVFPSPTADFTSNSQVCQGDTIFFTNQSFVTIGTILGYVWDFGDGNTSTALNPSHVYDTAGVFDVWLYVNSVNGCTDSISYQVNIYDHPEVNFGFENACLNEQPIRFSDSTTVQFGTVIQTVWEFGDGNSSISQNPTHTYATPGAYTVTLLKTSSNGCTDSISHTVNIFPMPTADFSITRLSNDSCGPNQQFQFTNLSVGAQGHFWDFNFNNQPNTDTIRDVNSPIFTYQDTGVYEIMLIAFNGFGCTDTIIQQVVVSPIPEANFVADTLTGCIPLTVTFNDVSQYSFSAPSSIIAWHWDFGDGNSVTTNTDSVVYTYNDPGLFDVTLTVETSLGCTDSITLGGLINALPTPIPDFTVSEQNAKTLTFVNTSQDVDTDTRYFWDFGDFVTSDDFSPTHIYNIDLLEKDYSFEVCLTATNANNCDSTICKTIEINGYRLYVPNAFAPDLTDVGDGNVFLPKGHSLREYHLRIYDKWGNLLFQSTQLDENGEPAEFWDGIGPSGEPLPMGAYAWVIEARFDDGSDWQGKEYDNGTQKSFGTVTLIR